MQGSIAGIRVVFKDSAFGVGGEKMAMVATGHAIKPLFMGNGCKGKRDR